MSSPSVISSDSEQRDDTERKVQELLREAGLDYAPVDPSSLEALKEMVSKPKVGGDAKERGLLFPGGNQFAAPSNVISSIPVTAGAATSEKAAASWTENLKPPPVSQVKTDSAVLQRAVSDLTVNPRPAKRGDRSAPAFSSSLEERPSGRSDGDSEAATAGSAQGSSSSEDAVVDRKLEPLSVEERILKQLERQHALLVDLRRRMDELSYTVHYMQRQTMETGGPAHPIHQSAQRNPFLPPGNANADYGARPQHHLQQEAGFAVTSTDRRLQGPGDQQQRFVDPRQVQQPEQRVPPPAGQNAEAAAGNNDNANNPIVSALAALMSRVTGIPNQVRNSRFSKIVSLFFALSRRELPNLDLGMILKVVIMLAILSARMQASWSSSSKTEVDSLRWIWKFYILTSLVVMGFLVRSGYVGFCYRFFVKENYPARIWSGEEIDVNNPGAGVARVAPNVEVGRGQPPQPQPQQQQPQQREQREAPAAEAPRPQPQVQEQGGDNNDGNFWDFRDTFLGGRIAAPEEGQGNNPARFAVRIAQDIVFLFGSFFLSIFPMWVPEAAPEPEAEEEPIDDPAAAAPPPPQPGHGQQGAPPARPDGGGPARLPRVRPPRDPVEPEEEADI